MTTSTLRRFVSHIQREAKERKFKIVLVEMGIEIWTPQKVNVEEKNVSGIMQREMTERNKETEFHNERRSYKLLDTE